VTSGFQSLSVEVDGVVRPAKADVSLVGLCEEGDSVVINTAAVDLELGSGGFDLVHVNLTRGLNGMGVQGAHVMKLNYSSLQHAVVPVESSETLNTELGKTVAVVSLHGQLPPTVWACKKRNPELKVGYIQSVGGALPGGLSNVVKKMQVDGLLCGHITAGQSYGGQEEAISTAGALDYAFRESGWDVAVCGPGPGILGSGSRLGNGALEALNSAHTALALGCKVVLVPRMSSGDQRDRHHGLSHHTQTVIQLLLKPVTVAIPETDDVLHLEAFGGHNYRSVRVDVEGYVESGLPVKTMGRTVDQDRLFFAAALAGGCVTAESA